MISENADAFLMQETWLNGNSVKTIRGYTIFYHGLDSINSNRGERGSYSVITKIL